MIKSDKSEQNMLSAVLWSLFIIIQLTAVDYLYGQQNTGVRFGFPEGVIIEDHQEKFSLKLGSRFQSQFFTSITGSDNPSGNEADFILRRMRFTIKGDLKEKRIDFKIQPSFDRGKAGIRHAYVRWNFSKNARIWIGQNKLPVSRGFLNSSFKLQLIERSVVESIFGGNYDTGIGFENETSIGESILIQQFSISNGDGIGFQNPNNGLMYTGKLTYLPLGEFSGNGYLAEPDLVREKEPKLAVGVSYNFNNNAGREFGTRGSTELPATADMGTFLSDFIFKYKGYSVSGVVSHRETDFGQQFFEGWGWNFQGGYLFTNSWELALRISEVQDRLEEYTLGVNKYLIEHHLKAMFNLSRRDRESLFGTGPDLTSYLFRFQFQFYF